MGRWSREELEAAFESYQRIALACGPAQSWDPFVDLFTEDCIYVDHPGGVIGGREALRRHPDRWRRREPPGWMLPRSASTRLMGAIFGRAFHLTRR